LRDDFEATALAHEYALHGADALSVLTEPEFFRGDHEFLLQARLASGRPCLMKDFVLDPYQNEEAVHYGADAILLILALLDGSEFRDLQSCAKSHHLDVLVEVHSEEELGRALEGDSDLIGINNRDLETFEIDPQITARLHPLVDHGIPVVSESGIATPDDIRMFSGIGIDAVLIGEHFMRAERPGRALDQLREAATAAVRVRR
jgi:indole-3-glycerol phosphate synthase